MNNTVNRLMPDSTPAALATELIQIEEAFNLAMISNDVSRIGACIADDWVLVTPEVGIVSRARILQVIESGELSHDTMTKDVSRVRVYGDIAVVTYAAATPATSEGSQSVPTNGSPTCIDGWTADGSASSHI